MDLQVAYQVLGHQPELSPWPILDFSQPPSKPFWEKWAPIGSEMGLQVACQVLGHHPKLSPLSILNFNTHPAKPFWDFVELWHPFKSLVFL